MSRRRPTRAWVGSSVPIDASELTGPRGLVQEVLDGRPEDHAGELSENAAFYWKLLSEARQQRILSVIDARLSSVAVVLDRLLDPHNTAAILRTSEGLGLARVHVIPHEVDDALAHRRVTQDAHKWVSVEQHESGAAAALALRAQGFEVWAGHLDEKAVLFTELPDDRPVALLFGNEHEGPQPPISKIFFRNQCGNLTTFCNNWWIK